MFREGIAEDRLRVLLTLLSPVTAITKLGRDGNSLGYSNVRELTHEVRQRFNEAAISFALHSK
jgi:hypothetical protein